MKKFVSCLVLLFAATIGSASAQETTYSARNTCEATQSGGKAGRFDGSVRATRNTDFHCYLPRNIWNQIRGSYVRVKPGSYRSGYDRLGCRMIIYPPYGSDGERAIYGDMKYASGTSPQSLYVNVPSAFTYGQLDIQCFTRTNDKIYGFHLQNN